jgi:Na+/phosphate symporter
VVPGREDDVVFVPRHLQRPAAVDTPAAIAQIEKEIAHILTLPEDLLAELESIVADPKKYSAQVRQLRDYAAYLDGQVSDVALDLSGRDLSPAESARLAGLVRISKLGQVLADQTGELVEIVHQIQERGIVIADASREAIQHTLIPCSMNMKTLADAFPDITETVNDTMRAQDDLLRETITRQYGEYLERFASKKTPSGSEFSRVLFQIESMATTIREIRKTARLLGPV